MRADFDYCGRRVLVTGAAGGIGRAVAEGFAVAGADLVIVDLDPSIRSVGKEIGGKATAIECDISDGAAVREALGALGPIDVLVNNAGLERPTPLDGPDPETDAVFDRVIDVNIRGTRNVTRAVVPRMQAGGRILLTASIWGRTAVPDFSAYVASKHAIIGLTRTWAQELGPRGIRVNAICPGWVRTKQAMGSLARMAEAQGRSEQDILAEVSEAQALAGVMDPVDVAGLFLFLGSDAAANITGQAINVDRGEVMS
ncbi:SDR family NAD(P)-dependent oxidoreductase [Tropicimonas sp. IMCC6043]|uniref:SDR family NAD(P)-dependent oxidoreductase n=1 Tax=Tropicimonas sp. IMCC6043 TaxID=2510645 RepID=UPI00101D795D|nr:SDR family NAD(P)-dependent oxidoreductase [Tropicimonas sp. IMCC6043]RYH06574.1 SDR family oxidoreductase [Tropicimonas sp. IMCC6043]